MPAPWCGPDSPQVSTVQDNTVSNLLRLTPPLTPGRRATPAHRDHGTEDTSHQPGRGHCVTQVVSARRGGHRTGGSAATALSGASADGKLVASRGTPPSKDGAGLQDDARDRPRGSDPPQHLRAGGVRLGIPLSCRDFPGPDLGKCAVAIWGNGVSC